MKSFIACVLFAAACCGLGAAAELQPHYKKLSTELDRLRDPAPITVPPVAVSILPFRPIGNSNAAWFGDSIPAYIKKAVEDRYQLGEVKLPDNDTILLTLPKRNISEAHKQMFVAAYLSADIVVFGSYKDIAGRDAIELTPSVYITQTRELKALAPFEVPVSSDIAKIAGEIAEKIGELMVAEAVRVGNEPSQAGSKKQLNFLKIPTLSFSDAGLRLKTTDAGAETLPDRERSTLARKAAAHLQAKLRAQHLHTAPAPGKLADFVISTSFAVTAGDEADYRIDGSIQSAKHDKPATFKVRGKTLARALEKAAQEIVRKLHTFGVTVSVEAVGLKEAGASLSIAGETHALPTNKGDLSLNRPFAPGTRLYPKVNDAQAAARDCFFYSGHSSQLLSENARPYVVCAYRSYPIRVKLSGLLFDAVAVNLNESETLTMTENAEHTFERYIDDHDTFSLAVLRQPDEKGHVCRITGEASGRLNGSAPAPIEIVCIMPVQHEVYTSFGLPLFVQPNGAEVLQRDGDFVYRKVGLSGFGIVGYRNRFALPWKIMAGGEVGYLMGGGEADVLGGSGKVYFPGESFSFSMLQFNLYTAYKFRFSDRRFALIPALGVAYSFHRARMLEQDLYSRNLPGLLGAVFVQYEIRDPWYLEGALRATYFGADTSLMLFQVSAGGGYRF